ncbi:hypothetical protein [Streptomyces sp. NPDC046759]|uniref:hypothetical protein n=1 Tax=Streptomyces sp. NPDC046759 TaxID=3155019 RepID=UPI0033C6D40B
MRPAETRPATDDRRTCVTAGQYLALVRRFDRSRALRGERLDRWWLRAPSGSGRMAAARHSMR